MSGHLSLPLGVYLLNSLWQVPLLFCTGWFVAKLARKIGPAAEHRVWVGVLALQTFLPACSFDPLRQVPWLAWLRELLTWTGTSTGTAQVSTTFGPGLSLTSLSLSSAWLPACLLAYGTVTLYFAFRFAWSARQLAILRHRSRPVPLTNPAQPNPAERSWDQCSQHFGVHKAMLRLSLDIPGPITIGVRNKLILLPAPLLTNLPDEDLHTVLAHEFAHLRRNDFAKNLAYELLRLPISYHPVYWLTRSRVTETRELVCDAMAADAVAGRARYARALLRLANLRVNGRAATVSYAIGIFDANQFERRIMKLTQSQRQLSAVQRVIIITACVTVGLVTCASALAMRTYHSNGPEGQDTAAASGTKKPVQVSAAVMAASNLAKVQPTYPEAAKTAKIQGAVVLHAVISKDGTIENLQVVSGPEELRASSLDAVRQWTYKPYLLNGNPVEVETTITVTYSLVS